MQAYEINNNIHHQNHAIKADDDRRSRKRTVSNINHPSWTDKKKYRVIQCKTYAPISPSVNQLGYKEEKKVTGRKTRCCRSSVNRDTIFKEQQETKKPQEEIKLFYL